MVVPIPAESVLWLGLILIGFLFGFVIALWWRGGRDYAKGYEHGQEDLVPMAGTCDDCGWDMPPADDVMAMVQNAINHTMNDCPARRR